MQRQVLILSDEHIGSYAGIGDLLARTLQAVGVSVRHLPLSAARAPQAITTEHGRHSEHHRAAVRAYSRVPEHCHGSPRVGPVSTSLGVLR